MVIVMFNRNIELNLLKNAVNSNKAELVILYGRRRLGKTTLIQELLADYENSIYLFTPQGSIDDILDIFSEAITTQANEFIKFSNWKDFLEYLRKKSEKKFIIAIDEFQRIAESYEPAMSLLQHYWDNYFSKSKIKIILIGSVIGMIERIALKGQSPLFGRKTREFRIDLLPYFITRKYWKNLTELEKIERYGYFGGTPGYFTLTKDEKSVFSLIEELVLSPDAPLAREPEALISEELRAPATYMTILSQLAKSGRGLPLSKIKIRKGTPTSYLRQLSKMDLIEKLESIAQGATQYLIKDEFFRFWFYFIYPRQNLIESKRGHLILDVISREKDNYLAVTFEKILRELILYSSGTIITDLEIPIIDKLGSYWWKDLEVDGCALAGDTVIVGEAKWQTKNISPDDARTFIKKMELIKDNLKKKKVIGFFISKSEISSAAQNIFKDNVICLDLDNLGYVLDNLFKQTIS